MHNNVISLCVSVITDLPVRSKCDERHLCRTGLHCDRCSRQDPTKICVSANVTYHVPSKGMVVSCF